LRDVSAGLSEREAAAFAAIVERLGDPERRRFWRVALAAASGFLATAIAVQVAVLGWPWAAVVTFVITFVVGLATGVLLLARFVPPGPR
jgi:uncharacterized membrane protein YccC